MANKPPPVEDSINALTEIFHEQLHQAAILLSMATRMGMSPLYIADVCHIIEQSIDKHHPELAPGRLALRPTVDAAIKEGPMDVLAFLNFKNEKKKKPDA